MKIITIHLDTLTQIYCGELRAEENKIDHIKMTKNYGEILAWAKEHNARIIDLDIAEMLEDYL
jgi:hypothetical protein